MIHTPTQTKPRPFEVWICVSFLVSARPPAPGAASTRRATPTPQHPPCLMEVLSTPLEREARAPSRRPWLCPQSPLFFQLTWLGVLLFRGLQLLLFDPRTDPVLICENHVFFSGCPAHRVAQSEKTVCEEGVGRGKCPSPVSEGDASTVRWRGEQQQDRRVIPDAVCARASRSFVCCGGARCVLRII